MHEQTERQCIPSKGLFTKESLEDQAHSFYCIVFAGVRGNKKTGSGQVDGEFKLPRHIHS